MRPCPPGVGPHEGREFDLMRAGQKHVALFLDWEPEGMDAMLADGFLMLVSADTTAAGKIFYNRIVYRQGYSAQAERLRALIHAPRAGWDEGHEYEVGTILGYSRTEVEAFLAHVRKDTPPCPYQIHPHAGTWPRLDLSHYLRFLTRQLDLQDTDLITLVLADDAFVQSRNRAHRGKDTPTNVLAYPADLDGELGDLIFAVETLEREAAAQGKTLDQHLKHLILHGSLHLLGHDHETPLDAAKMESLETHILGAYGLPDPYASLA